MNSTNVNKQIPWKYSFELKTHQRDYELFAPSQEERDLWVNGFNRILAVPVFDDSFVPMGIVSKQTIDAGGRKQANRDPIKNEE